MDDDVVSTRCPECGSELEVEPFASDHHLAMALRCPQHGHIGVLEPF